MAPDTREGADGTNRQSSANEQQSAGHLLSIGLGPWPLYIVGSEGEGFSVHHNDRRKPPIYLNARTLAAATREAIEMGVAGDLDLKPYERPTRREAELVYFIAGDVGAIKIGSTFDPVSRLNTLQCGSPIPLKILAVTDGGTTQERAYHKRFAAHRLHGEWFERCPEILAEIERLAA